MESLDYQYRQGPLYNSNEDIIGHYHTPYWYCPYCLRYYESKTKARIHERRCAFRITPIDENILIIDAEYYRLMENNRKRKRLSELIDNLAYISRRTQGIDFPSTSPELVTREDYCNTYQKVFIYIEDQRPLGFLTVTFNHPYIKDGRLLAADCLVFEYCHRRGITRNLFSYMLKKLSTSPDDMIFDLTAIGKYTKVTLSFLKKYHKLEIVRTFNGRIKVNDWLKDFKEINGEKNEQIQNGI